MTSTATPTWQPGDVVRTKRFGNVAVGNYVIDRVVGDEVRCGGFAVHAHREYGSQRPTFMMLTVDGARVLRSYGRA